MKHLGLIGAVLPLVLLAIGMIGWVLTVRNDVTDAIKQITAVQEEVAPFVPIDITTLSTTEFSAV